MAQTVETGTTGLGSGSPVVLSLFGGMLARASHEFDGQDAGRATVGRASHSLKGCHECEAFTRAQVKKLLIVFQQGSVRRADFNLKDLAKASIGDAVHGGRQRTP